jgi:RNA polymerase sigma-70 factor, ECF subfamily
MSSADAKTPLPDPHPGGRELDDLTLAHARRGEEQACRALFRRYQGPVFALLWRMLGHRASLPLVEDLTQETFLRVFRGLAGFSTEGPARLSTWILTIAARLARNELRRQRSAPAISPDAEATARVESADRADEYAERRALGALIARELDRLDPQYRAIFLLREYHDLSYEEISRALDIEMGTVKSRLSRAREALRQALEGHRHG